MVDMWHVRGTRDLAMWEQKKAALPGVSLHVLEKYLKVYYIFKLHLEQIKVYQFFKCKVKVQVLKIFYSCSSSTSTNYRGTH